MPLNSPEPVSAYSAVSNFQMAALGTYLELVEARLKVVEDSKGKRKVLGPDVPTTRRQLQEAVVLNVLPMTMRDAYLVALYATYESTVLEIGEFLRLKLRSDAPPLKPGREGALEASEKYFVKHFNFSRVDSKSEEGLRFVYRLRNAFAHGAGRRYGMKRGLWEQLVRDQQSRPSIVLDRNAVEPSAELTREAFVLVRDSVRELVERGRSALRDANINE